MIKHPILLNDPPYGSWRSFNGLRMAQTLAKWWGMNKAMIAISRQLAILLRRMQINGTEFCWTAETKPA